jgi:hypothetical protein
VIIALHIANVVAWSAIAALGYRVLHSAARGAVVFHPSSAQLVYYLYAPLFLAALAAVALAASRMKRLSLPAAIAAIVQLFAIIPYMLPFTGGL